MKGVCVASELLQSANEGLFGSLLVALHWLCVRDMVTVHKNYMPDPSTSPELTSQTTLRMASKYVS